jgi:hypothetical protein
MRYPDAIPAGGFQPSHMAMVVGVLEDELSPRWMDEVVQRTATQISPSR